MSDPKWLRKQKHFDWMQKCLICWKKCEKLISYSILEGKSFSQINLCRDTIEMCKPMHKV